MTSFTKAKALSFVAAAVIACTAASPALAGLELVVNGGFETAGPPGPPFTFPGWTQFGDQTFNSEICNSPGNFTEGACSGWLGPVATTAGISQSIAVNAGGYNIQFDVRFFDGSGAPDSILATFDGQTLLSLVDQPAGGFTHYSFIVDSHSAHNANLVFTAQNDASFVILDAVSVQAPEPASLALLGLGLVGLGFSRRKLTS